MPSLNDKEVKESLKKNEEKITLRFNTCLILLNDIEHVVRNATNTWKNIYLLHKPSDFVVSVSEKDGDDDEQKEDEEIDDEEVTHFDNVDDEEEQGQEATKEDVQETKAIDPTKIAIVVIVSLPHSSRKVMKTSSSKKTSVGLIMVKIVDTSTQTIFAPIQLNTTLNEVSSASSTKLTTLPSTSVLCKDS